MLVFFTFGSKADQFEAIPDVLDKHCDPEDLVYFTTLVKNESNTVLDFLIIKDDSQLPEEWYSSFCVGGREGTCFAPFMDTVDVELGAGESIEILLDVQTCSEPSSGAATFRLELADDPQSNFECVYTAHSGNLSVRKILTDSARKSLSGRHSLYLSIGRNGISDTRRPYYTFKGQLIRGINSGGKFSGSIAAGQYIVD